MEDHCGRCHDCTYTEAVARVVFMGYLCGREGRLDIPGKVISGEGSATFVSEKGAFRRGPDCQVI